MSGAGVADRAREIIDHRFVAHAEALALRATARPCVPVTISLSMSPAESDVAARACSQAWLMSGP